jgi:D-hydroxyproline dehydrogenase subunit beta
MSNATYDVVIVGAGIVGAACAYECAQRGMCVAVVDRDVVGGGATGAAMGHIVVMDDSDAQFALTRYSQTLWHELRPELPPEVEYEQCGTIWVAADETEMTEVLRKRAYYARHAVPVEVLSSLDLERLEPNLRKGMAGGLLVPQDGVLYPPCAARFLMDRALLKGAVLYSGATVSQMAHGMVQLSDSRSLSAAGHGRRRSRPELM